MYCEVPIIQKQYTRNIIKIRTFGEENCGVIFLGSQVKYLVLMTLPSFFPEKRRTHAAHYMYCTDKENEVDKEDLARSQPLPPGSILGCVWQLSPHAMNSIYPFKDHVKSSVGGVLGYFVDLLLSR